MLEPVRRVGRRVRAARGPHALVGVPNVPAYDRRGGERRIADLIDLLRDQGFSVTLAAREEGRERYAEELRDRGVEVVDGVGAQIEDVARRRPFALALLAFWRVGEAWLPRLRACSPDTVILVDSVDLHFVRESRTAFVAAGTGGAPGRLVPKYGRRYVRELNTYVAADRVLTVSEKEAALVNDLIGDPDLATAVPDFADLRPSPVGFEERRGMVFVGNFDHRPNVAAVEYLCDEVAPRIPASVLEEHPLQIVGHGLEGDLAARCRATPGVEPVGWVPLVEPHLGHARVCVAPLLYGAGTKRKVIEALTVGAPTVTTSIGAEGLPVVSGDEVLVADDPDAFARSVRMLAQDEALWSRLVEAGRRRMAEHHSREQAATRLRDAIEATLAHPRAAGRGLSLSASP